MANPEHVKEKSGGFLSWMAWIIGSAGVVYLLGFALLVLFPGTQQVARAIGLSADAIETIYYPIIRLLER